jgi:hypothetical protein
MTFIRYYKRKVQRYLRHKCERLTYKQQRMAVAAMFMLIAILSVYMLLSAIIHFGKGGTLEIQHIKQSELIHHSNRSTNHLNYQDYETIQKRRNCYTA